MKSNLDIQDFRFLIFGAGAIGTYIGVSLIKSGQKVVFLEKPREHTRIKENGLRLVLGSKSIDILHPEVFNNLPEAFATGRFDFAIFAMKSFDTKEALTNLTSIKSDFPPIICLQNGVENEIEIARAIGDERVIPGTLTSAIGRLEKKAVVLERLRGVGFAKGHPAVKSLVQVFNEAGLRAKTYSSAPAMKWSKLLTKLLTNATAAILGVTPDAILSNPGLFRIELAQLREALNVMAAMGIKVTDLPGTPVRLLAAIAHLPPRFAQPLLYKAVSGGRGGKMPSLYIDLHGKRGKVEVDYLNGAVFRYGHRIGIPTPTNRLLTDVLLALVNDEAGINSYSNNPERLINEWRKITQERE